MLQIHCELARDPAKMFIAVREESIKSEFAYSIEGMERQFQEPFCAIPSWCSRAPVVVQSNDEAGCRMPRNLCSSVHILPLFHGLNPCHDFPCPLVVVAFRITEADHASSNAGDHGFGLAATKCFHLAR